MSDSNNKVSLGCGTLILIAVIVLIFGNANNDKDLLREVRRLQSDVRALKNAAAARSGSGELDSVIKEIKAEMKAQSATLAEIKANLEKAARPPRQRILPSAVPQIEAE